jgi:hypothetical protein
MSNPAVDDSITLLLGFMQVHLTSSLWSMLNIEVQVYAMVRQASTRLQAASASPSFESCCKKVAGGGYGSKGIG